MSSAVKSNAARFFFNAAMIPLWLLGVPVYLMAQVPWAGLAFGSYCTKSKRVKDCERAVHYYGCSLPTHLHNFEQSIKPAWLRPDEPIPIDAADRPSHDCCAVTPAQRRPSFSADDWHVNMAHDQPRVDLETWTSNSATQR